MAVPTYQPNQVSSDNAPAVSYSPDQFGAQTGAAASRLGGAVITAGAHFSAIEQQAKERQDSADVMAAYAKASDALRTKLYGEDGIFLRQGGNAAGMAKATDAAVREIFHGTLTTLSDPDQQVAFDQMWQRKHAATMDTAATTEASALQQYRTEAKAAALKSAEADAVANYNSPDALEATLDAARAMVRSNPDGLPPEAVAGIERDTISGMQVSVIQRLAQDNPGDALDYYEAHKSEISGKDHTVVQQIIGGVADARAASAATAEITDAGHAVTITSKIYGGSDAQAAPPITIDPTVAEQIAQRSGDTSLEGMSHDEIAAYLASPEGRSTSQRIASNYLGVQLKTFDGDLEASLIAVHEGGERARLFLDNGRDYSVLADPEGTAAAVASEVERYAGQPVRDKSSVGVQAALTGQSQMQFQGDAQAFLDGRYAGSSTDKLALSGQTASHLAALIDDAPEEIASQLSILRGKGDEADLGWAGGSFTDAPPEVQAWLFDNAPRYGLGFPKGQAPWHIQADAPNADANPDAQPAVGIPVALSPQTGAAADLYGKPQGAYRVTGMKGDLSDWLAAAEERYRDNPSLRAEVERQLTNAWNLQKTDKKASDTAALQDGFARIIKGEKIADLDPLMLQTMGPENVSKLLTLEGKFQKGGDNSQTDDATYYKLSQMDPTEFAKVDLIDYADKLSGADFRSMADRQAVIARGGADGAAVAGTRTRLQIVNDTFDMLGLKPNSNANDATKANLLNRALDDRVTAFAAENKRAPSSTEIQKMVDDLIITGHQPTSMSDELFGNHLFGIGLKGDQRAYELKPEELSSFTIADNFGEVPAETHDVIANGYRSIYGINPGETEATDYYNDMVRVRLGATVSPPPVLGNTIAQGLADRLQRKPTQEEIDRAYSRMIKLSAGM